MSDENLTRLIPLANLEPNDFNPRRHFDKDALSELAESIKAHGVLEPLIVRPIGFPGVPAKNNKYEIVAGERRFRAAKLAKLDSVPCLVKPIGDREALEIAVVENEQRADVAPLDKAVGYARLINDHGVSVNDLAGRVGKSASTIRGLLRLTRLPKLAADALADGTISASVAELIARIPGEAARQDAAELVTAPLGRRGATDNSWRPWIQRPLSYRDCKEMVAEKFCRELKQAPFSPKDAGLNGTGACTDCPDRVGNLQKAEPEAYAGCRADVCTNVECYAGKVEAWQARTEAAAEDNGHKVLSAKASSRLFYGSGGLCYDAGYVDFAEQCEQDKQSKRPRSFKQLLEKHLEPGDVAVAFDGRGKQHKLVRKDKAKEILKREHKINLSTDPYRYVPTAKEKAERAKQAAEERLRREIDAAVLEACAEKAAQQLPMLIRFGRTSEILARMAAQVVEAEWGSAAEVMLKRRGCTGKNLAEKREAFAKATGGMKADDLLGALCEVLVSRCQQGWEQKGYLEWLQLLEVDAKAIEKGVRARAKVEEKAKGKKASK